jgi:hypothetical protein
MLIGKLKDRVVEIIKVQSALIFAEDKSEEFVLINLKPGDLQSLEVVWLPVADTRFEWVHEFHF